MPGHDIIVIGASAGGVEALQKLARDLPPDLAAAVFVVLHVPAHSHSVLPAILSRCGPLPAVHPADGEPIQPGRIYVAPPDFHLLVHRGTVRLSRGPRENGHRPAVDPLFRAAAREFGGRVIGVVLSGTLDDGTAGLIAVKRSGGLAVVQDPADALYSSMPRNAIQHAPVDHVVPLAEVGPLLVGLVAEPAPVLEDDPVPDEMKVEVNMAEMDIHALNQADRPGTPSGFACPDCGGALWELDEADLVRFRCRVGHAWTANGLLTEQADALERALWVALRALEERAALADRLARRMRDRKMENSADRFDGQALTARQQALEIRRVLLHGSGSGQGDGNGNGGEAAPPPVEDGAA